MKSSSIFLSLSLLFAAVVLSSAAPFSSPTGVSSPNGDGDGEWFFGSAVSSNQNSKRDDNSGWILGVAQSSSQNPSQNLTQRDGSQLPPVNTPNTPTLNTKENPVPATQDTKDNPSAQSAPAIPKNKSPVQNAPATQNPPTTPNAKNTPETQSNPNAPSTPDVHTTFYKDNQLLNAACYGRNGLKPYNAKPTDYIAAIHMSDFEMCFKCIQVKNCETNKTTTVKVIDKCAGCAPGCIDLTQTAFKCLAPLDQGVINIAWRPITCPADGDWPDYEHDQSSSSSSSSN
ncbi:8306_t:CDS:2 [Dentiscutata erythropus]|uniref:8306_t:CDS:1 n=1 Tax=Dentiscutata erythropus TaxID=1348616 RepID=A0A9N9EXA3_9GLOM|nr:8306_t:CDS:2 [Dentiscutata erythropus]